MPDRSRLVTLRIRNLGCIGPDGVEIALDNIVCLVGRNNTGKSMVLRAYELAQGSKALTENDRCLWTPQGQGAEVELDVHIPDGLQNVDKKWKIEYGDLKLVRSRWRWGDIGAKPIRQTWDPESNDGQGGWAEDEKAGGADNVFNSRLPQPLRIDSLGDAFKEHDELLKLVTDPIATELKKLQAQEGSILRVAIESLTAAALGPVAQYQADITTISQQVQSGLKGVFPDLGCTHRRSYGRAKY